MADPISTPNGWAKGEVAVSRWWRVVGGLLMNLALGSLYAWSVFVAPLEKEFGWKRAQTSSVFGWAVVVFAISFIIAGRLQDKLGPFKISMVGCILLTIGFLACAKTTSLAYLIVCFGVIVGIGNGFGYATPIPVMAKWFPDKRGLAVGLAVAGYGGGSAIFGPLANLWLIPKYGWRTTFVVLGIVFFLMTLIGALLLKNPPVGYRPAGWAPAPASKAAATTHEFPPGEMLRTPTFYFMWVAYALGTSAGLMVISQLVPLAKSMNIPTAALQTMTLLIGAAGNAFGRIFSGWMSDALGRLNVLRLMIGISAVAMLVLSLTGNKLALLYGMVFIVYWCFGTQLSVNASATSDFWGTKNAGINFGLLFTAWAAAGIIGPRIGGKLFDIHKDYQAAFYRAGVLAVIALVCQLLARLPVPQRYRPVTVGGPAEWGKATILRDIDTLSKVDERNFHDIGRDLAAPEVAPAADAVDAASGSATPGGPGFTPVRIFYATDRKRSGRPEAGRFYSPDRGDGLEFGFCDLTIPTDPRLRHVGQLTGPSILTLDFILRFDLTEDSTRHVILSEVLPQAAEVFLAQLRGRIVGSTGKEALVFIHGYNVTFEDAARRTAQLAYDLCFLDAPILYSWPSRGHWWRYGADEATVEWTQPHFIEFLELLAAQSGAAKIHIIAHSMGARALARTVKEYVLRRAGPPVFREVILAAPDIDRGVFLQLASHFPGAAGRVTLYASSRDRALLLSKLFHLYTRAGQSGRQIVVLDGVDTIDASAADTSLVGHAYFAATKSILGDIYHLVRNALPPASRFSLQRRTTAGRAYWVYLP